MRSRPSMARSSAAAIADDPLDLKSYAAVWRSTDGLTWTRDADTAGVFDGGRIWAMADEGRHDRGAGHQRRRTSTARLAPGTGRGDGVAEGTDQPDDGGAIAAVVATSTAALSPWARTPRILARQSGRQLTARCGPRWPINLRSTTTCSRCACSRSSATPSGLPGRRLAVGRRQRLGRCVALDRRPDLV